MGLLQGLAAGIAGGAAFMVDDIRAEIAQKRQAALEEARAAREDVTWGKRRERLNQDQIDQEERGYNNKLRELDEAQRRSDEQNQKAQDIYDSVQGDNSGGWQSDEDKANEESTLNNRRLEAMGRGGMLNTDLGKIISSRIASSDKSEIERGKWENKLEESRLRDERRAMEKDEDRAFRREQLKIMESGRDRRDGDNGTGGQHKLTSNEVQENTNIRNAAKAMEGWGYGETGGDNSRQFFKKGSRYVYSDVNPDEFAAIQKKYELAKKAYNGETPEQYDARLRRGKDIAGIGKKEKFDLNNYF